MKFKPRPVTNALSPRWQFSNHFVTQSSTYERERGKPLGVFRKRVHSQLRFRHRHRYRPQLCIPECIVVREANDMHKHAPQQARLLGYRPPSQLNANASSTHKRLFSYPHFTGRCSNKKKIRTVESFWYIYHPSMNENTKMINSCIENETSRTSVLAGIEDRRIIQKSWLTNKLFPSHTPALETKANKD